MHELQDLEVKLKEDLAPEKMLHIIFHYISLIAPEKDLDLILLYMADMRRELILADRCTLWLHDKETHQLWTKVARGVEALTMPAEAGLAGYALKTTKASSLRMAIKTRVLTQKSISRQATIQNLFS